MDTSMPGRFEGAPRFGPWVVRERLLGVLERSKPSGLLLAAPAGYGKTCLAAQFASMTAFRATAWVSCEGEALAGDALLSLVAECVQRVAAPQGHPDIPAVPLNPSTSDVLNYLRDAFRMQVVPSRLCIVVDDIRPSDAFNEIRLLHSLLEHESHEAVLVLTTRSLLDDFGLEGAHVVKLGVDELTMDRRESRQLIEIYSGVVIDDRDAERLESQSQGHAALLSVLARQMALGTRGESSKSLDLQSLLLGLAAGQLTCEEQEFLYSLALLGSVSNQESMRLASVCGATDVRRILSCIPLIQWAGGDDLSGQRLIAHTLVQEVFSSKIYARELAKERRNVLRETCMSILERRSDYGRIIDLLLQENVQPRIQQWLENRGAEAVNAGFRLAVKSAVESVPPEVLLERPRLLLLAAELDLESYSRHDSLAKAAAVRELALCQGDNRTYADALMLLARNYMDDSAPLRAIEPLEMLLRMPDDTVDSSYKATAIAYLATYYVMMLDVTRVREMSARVDGLLAQASGATDLRARLLSQLGTAVFLMGDICQAHDLLQSAYACQPVPASLRAMVVGNYATILAEIGRLDYASQMATEALAITENCGLDLYHMTYRSAAGAVRFGLTGHASCLADGLEAANRLYAAGDHVSECLVRLQLVMMLRAAGRVPESVVENERVFERRLTQEALYLRYFAEAERAANLLAMNDLNAAAECAVQVRSACSNGCGTQHSVRADLVLAEVARRQGRLAEAMTRVSEHEEYLLSGSANWVVGMYMRAFPHLLGLIARSLGVARIPVHMLNMLVGDHIEDALSASREMLDESEWRLLATRLLGEKDSKTRIDALHMAPICRVKMFGGFEVTLGIRRVAERDWSKRKARLLFASLVLGQGREVPREQLYEHLWPEMDDERARNNFYVIWSAMKAVLTPDAGKKQPCPYVENAGGVCRSNPDLIRSDVEEFEALLTTIRKAEAAGNGADSLDAYERLAEIYRGDLLPGDMYDDWFSDARDRYRHDFGDAMLKAHAHLLSAGDTVSALRLVRKAIAADPWREDLYQAALRLQISAGQRSAAVETYLACRSRLVEDLGLDPCIDTVRLYEQVLAMEDGASMDGFC